MLAVFVFIALLDSISWVGGARDGDNLAAFRPQNHHRPHLPARDLQGGELLRAARRAWRSTAASRCAIPARICSGTDILGRDVVYRALKGVRVALLIGAFTSLVVIPIALLFGVTAGYFGRRIDDGVFFLITVLASVPSLLLLIALIMVLGRGTLQVCIALGVTGWVHFCRIARGETLKLREADYVDAARALGVSDTQDHHPPHPAQHRAPHHHHVRAVVHRAGAVGDDPVLSRHRPGRAAGAR